MSKEDGPWLSGRELLLNEIDRRIEGIRSMAEMELPVLAFRKGLLIFLERRVARLRDTIASLRNSISPIPESRMQTVDQMLSSVVETLRHVELEPFSQQAA
ncbi:MAG: hypothetical protein ABJC74_03570 [Gemmatimonadota bacterium]